METVIWLGKWVIGPIISVIVTLVISEPLKDRLAPLVSKFGAKKEDGLAGKWEATFLYGQNKVPYTEVIEISSLFGALVGKIIPASQNHATLKQVEKDFPLRLRGSIKDNRFFTGVWFHPLRRSHHHGAFELLVNQDGVHMSGIWSGYSETQNIIETGAWLWKRLD